MKILLPVDHSPFSQQALRSLVAQPHKRGTQVCVLNVIEPIAPYITAGLVPEVVFDSEKLEADRRKQAKALVARAAQKLRQAGFRTTELVEYGNPKSTILDQAERWGADLIVLGSHGLRGLSRFLLGSVSDAIVRHAKCSVVVVRARRAGRTKRS